MRLLSVVSKGNRIAKVRTYGAAGYMVELTELKAEGGEVSKRNYTRLLKMHSPGLISASIREAENWVDLVGN